MRPRQGGRGGKLPHMTTILIRIVEIYRSGQQIRPSEAPPRPPPIPIGALVSVSDMKQWLLSAWRMLTWTWRRFPKTVGGLTGLVALLCLVVVGSNAYILLTTDGEATRRRRRAARRSGDRAGRAGQRQRPHERDACRPRQRGVAALARRQGEDPRLRRPPPWAYTSPTDAQGAGPRRACQAGRHLRGPRRLRHLGDDGPGAIDLRRPNAVVVPRASTCRGPSSSPKKPGIHVTGLLADQHQLGLPGERRKSARSSPGSGGLGHHRRHARDGRAADPDPDLRRPRKLGPGRRRPRRPRAGHRRSSS